VWEASCLFVFFGCCFFVVVKWCFVVCGVCVATRPRVLGVVWCQLQIRCAEYSPLVRVGACGCVAATGQCGAVCICVGCDVM